MSNPYSTLGDYPNSNLGYNNDVTPYGIDPNASTASNSVINQETVKSKAPLYIGIVVAVVIVLILVGIAIWYFVLRGSSTTGNGLPSCTTSQMTFNSCVLDSKNVNTGMANYTAIATNNSICNPTTLITDTTHCPTGTNGNGAGTGITGSTLIKDESNTFSCRFDQLSFQNICLKDSNQKYTGSGLFYPLGSADVGCGTATTKYDVSNAPGCTSLCPDSLYTISTTATSIDCQPGSTTGTVTIPPTETRQLTLPAVTTAAPDPATTYALCPSTKNFPSTVCTCPSSYYTSPTDSATSDQSCDFSKGTRLSQFDVNKLPANYPKVKPSICPSTYAVTDANCNCTSRLANSCVQTSTSSGCTFDSKTGNYITSNNFTSKATPTTTPLPPIYTYTCPPICANGAAAPTATICTSNDILCKNNCQGISGQTATICYKNSNNNSYTLKLLENISGTTTCPDYCLLDLAQPTTNCTLDKNLTVCPKGDAASDSAMYGKCTPQQHIVSYNGTTRGCFPPINTPQTDLNKVEGLIGSCNGDDFNNLFPNLTNTNFYISAIECSDPHNDLNNVKVFTIDTTDSNKDSIRVKWDNYDPAKKALQLWKITSYSAVDDKSYKFKITSAADTTGGCFRNYGDDFRYRANPNECGDENSTFYMVSGDYYNSNGNHNDGNSMTYLGNVTGGLKSSMWFLRFYQLSQDRQLFVSSNQENNNVICTGNLKRAYENYYHVYRFFMFADPNPTVPVVPATTPAAT
jgi:hypothetical protein